MNATSRYRIVVRGELTDRFRPAFEPMTMEWEGGDTVLVGDVVDQGQLHALLDTAARLGLQIVEVERLREP